MNKLQLLFIRACKAKNPSVRVKSVYKRFYNRQYYNERDMAAILLTVVEECYPIPARKLIDELNPAHAWLYEKHDEKLTYHHHVLNVLITHLRLADASRISGWIYPAWVRNSK